MEKKYEVGRDIATSAAVRRACAPTNPTYLKNDEREIVPPERLDDMEPAIHAEPDSGPAYDHKGHGDGLDLLASVIHRMG